MEATETETPTASVDAYFEIKADALASLEAMARRIDANAGNEDFRYRGPADMIAAIFNGGTVDEIAQLFPLLEGWSFSPEGGW